MTRIFFTLAVFSLTLMLAALVVGLWTDDLESRRDAEVLRWLTVHRLTGVAAALMVVFVNSIVVTYFIGTSRWCKEVVATYGLDQDLVRQSTRLKRRTFPFALAAMLVILGVITLGAAADPMTGRAGTEFWKMPHLLAALAGVCLIAWAYLVQWNNIHANHQIIERVMSEVRRIRRERGLDSLEADAVR